MFRELLRSGHSTPTISQTVDSTRVALVGGAPRTQVVRHVEQLEAHERDDVDTLLVVFTMLSTRTITAPDLSGVIQKSEAEADALLRRLSAIDRESSNRLESQPGFDGPSIDCADRRLRFWGAAWPTTGERSWW